MKSEDRPIRLLAISGSLRAVSSNTALLRAAAILAPAGVEISLCDTLGDLPHFNPDLEGAEPQVVKDFCAQVGAADGIIISSPEYAHGVPGVLKNVIDWLSRPATDIGRVFGGRPVAFMGASPGGFGTTLGQNAWLPVLRTLGTQPWFGGRLIVSRAGTLFSPGGELTDAATRESVRKFIAGFVAFAERWE